MSSETSDAKEIAENDKFIVDIEASKGCITICIESLTQDSTFSVILLGLARGKMIEKCLGGVRFLQQLEFDALFSRDVAEEKSAANSN